MITLVGGTLLLLASIGLFFMLWCGIAAVLFPWIDRQLAKRADVFTVPLDDILKEEKQ